MRRWLVVIDDPNSELESEEEAGAYLKAIIEDRMHELKVARVRRGGLLADRVMEELPPVRHRLMGRARG